MDKHPFSFHVIFDSNKKYEIIDELDQNVTNLPTTPEQTDISHICEILDHLARFKLVRELVGKVENPSESLSAFKSSLAPGIYLVQDIC
jgi:hypothetical protein